MERSRYPDTSVKTANNPSTPAEPTEESEVKSICSLTWHDSSLLGLAWLGSKARLAWLGSKARLAWPGLISFGLVWLPGLV